jgi:hypothetical protein
MIFVGALIGVLHPTGVAGQKEDLTKVYESCIVKKIEKCESQADLLHTSGSVTLTMVDSSSSCIRRLYPTASALRMPLSLRLARSSLMIAPLFTGFQ